MAGKTEYPDKPGERSRWIEALRAAAPRRNVLDPWKPYAFLQESEVDTAGNEMPTATIFLTNQECPYRCLMCDLWINTLEQRVPAGAIPAQIRYALDRLSWFNGTAQPPPGEPQIKLYNAGSFFDPAAIPTKDYTEIATAIEPFDRVVVECHPALVGGRALAFQGLISGRLEVAIGLETVHAETLVRLNKRFTLDDFKRAACFLAQHQIDLRVFLLLRPPFMNEIDGVYWAKRSLETAFEAGASTCCVIPTRGGNGAMERLASEGSFTPPNLRSLEQVAEHGIRLGRGRVFADLWDATRFADCACSSQRVRRLDAMNRAQAIPTPIFCPTCESKLAPRL